MSTLLYDGLNITAIGMGVVFVLLTSLVFIIRGMSALSQMLEGPAQPPQPGTTRLPVSGDHADQELVIAIGAAIAAYRQRR